MPSAILHVEDDFALRELVQFAFEGYGFRGTMLTADTVAEAIVRLADAATSGTRLDLVISDMNLPDGSGLDVVQHIRSSPVWRATPVLILSGDLNPKNIGRAYALGANAYLDKSPPGRSLAQVTRSIYQHWTGDVLLPGDHPVGRVEQLIIDSIESRTRHARLYESVAERFTGGPSETAFWLSRSLGESNLINLLDFLRNRVEDRHLPERVAYQFEQMQTELASLLVATQRALEAPSITRVEVWGHMLDLVAATNAEVLARSIGHLFPVVPVAVVAVRDFFVGSIEGMAAWVELHTHDTDLLRRTALLRTGIPPLIQANAAIH